MGKSTVEYTKPFTEAISSGTGEGKATAGMLQVRTIALSWAAHSGRTGTEPFIVFHLIPLMLNSRIGARPRLREWSGAKQPLYHGSYKTNPLGFVGAQSQILRPAASAQHQANTGHQVLLVASSTTPDWKNGPSSFQTKAAWWPLFSKAKHMTLNATKINTPSGPLWKCSVESMTYHSTLHIKNRILYKQNSILRNKSKALFDTSAALLQPEAPLILLI